MLNQSGVTKTSYGSQKQILVNPANAFSVGIVVSNEGIEADSNGKKIIKAGTPLIGSLDSRTTAFKAATVDTATTAVCLALHDVDVTNGSANATGLVSGVVNKNKLESSVKTLVEKAKLQHIIAIAF